MLEDMSQKEGELEKELEDFSKENFGDLSKIRRYNKLIRGDSYDPIGVPSEDKLLKSILYGGVMF